MKKNILLIDDDSKLNALLTDYLSRFEFTVHAVTHPQLGLDYIAKQMPDLIILDVMLPEMDGFEACRRIRQKFSTPIIMLTARGEVTDRIVGLEIGADDYIPKPFEPRELVARIQTVLRRGSTAINPQSVQFDDLQIDFGKHSVRMQGELLDLTSAEFEMLTLFANNPAKVLNRDQIMDKIRGIEWDAFNRSVDVLISRLRQKLQDDPKHPRYIKTVWGSGYMFIGGSAK